MNYENIQGELRDQIKSDLDVQGKPSTAKAIDAEFKKQSHHKRSGVIEDNLKLKKIMKSKQREEWPTARRKLNVLGPSYRNKGHIYRVAEDPKDKDYIRKFRQETSSEVEGTFTERLTSKIDHAPSLYVDWWSELLLEDLLIPFGV